jgi:hypothetical protein
MHFEDYKVVLCRQRTVHGLAKFLRFPVAMPLCRAVKARWRNFPASFVSLPMSTAKKGLSLPSDTTEIVNA